MKRQSSILFLLTQDLESPSGLGRYWPLARELARLGHTVSIAALHPDFGSLQQTRFVKEGVDIRYVGSMHVRKNGNQKSYYPASQLVGVVLGATAALSRAALRHPTDIIVIGKPHPMNGLAGLFGATAKRGRLILDCDDYEAAGGHFSGKWQRPIVSWFEDHIPRHVDQVTTNTCFTRDRLLALGVPSAKITYLPNGVERQRFAEPEPADVEALQGKLGLAGRQVVGFFGSLSLPSHPLCLLVDAFGQVRASRPETIMLLVGGGEAYQDLKQQVQAAGLGQSVLFTGRVPPAQMPLYYRLAHVSVDPVSNDDIARARCPLKLFESWASEVPFVTGDVGDRRMLAGTPAAAYVVPPGDSAAFAQAILAVLTREGLAEDLRQAGLQRVQRFWWDQLAQGVEGLYEI